MHLPPSSLRGKKGVRRVGGQSSHLASVRGSKQTMGEQTPAGRDPFASDVSSMAAVLGDTGADLSARISAARQLGAVAGAQRQSGIANTCTNALRDQLELCDANDIDLNTVLVGVLVKLKAAVAAVAISAAYHAHRVDESVAGDWEQVRYKLGIGSRHPASWRRSAAAKASRAAPASPAAKVRAAPSQKHGQADKARRKRANKSRRRNRKKKRH